MSDLTEKVEAAIADAAPLTPEGEAIAEICRTISTRVAGGSDDADLYSTLSNLLIHIRVACKKPVGHESNAGYA